MPIPTTAPERKPAPEAGATRPENRAWGSCCESVRLALKVDPQVVERYLDKTTTARETALGVPHWPNRDPIGEEGGPNLYGFVLNNPIYWVDVLGLATVGRECTYTIYAGHTTRARVDEAWTKIISALGSKKHEENKYLSCAHCGKEGHDNLWPTTKSRDDHWDDTYGPTDPDVQSGKKKAGDRKYPTAKKDDPIIGDELEKLIKDAESKKVPAMCGKACDGNKVCSKIKLKIWLSSSPSMVHAKQNDKRVNRASTYSNTYDCEKKKWTNKLF